MSTLRAAVISMQRTGSTKLKASAMRGLSELAPHSFSTCEIETSESCVLTGHGEALSVEPVCASIPESANIAISSRVRDADENERGEWYGADVGTWAETSGMVIGAKGIGNLISRNGGRETCELDALL